MECDICAAAFEICAAECSFCTADMAFFLSGWLLCVTPLKNAAGGAAGSRACGQRTYGWAAGAAVPLMGGMDGAAGAEASSARLGLA